MDKKGIVVALFLLTIFGTLMKECQGQAGVLIPHRGRRCGRHQRIRHEFRKRHSHRRRKKHGQGNRRGRDADWLG